MNLPHPILPLDTPRTRIVLLGAEHADLVLAYRIANREHLIPWEPVRNDEYYTKDACTKACTDAARLALEDRAYGFALLTPDEQMMIGSVNFNNIVRAVFQACHLGYSVAASHQGQGVMAEALVRLIDFMFDDMDIHRIMANYLPYNERSGRLLERLGFTREGYAQRYLKINGVWQDHVLTAKVRERD